jgi:hypothetical protein
LGALTSNPLLRETSVADTSHCSNVPTYVTLKCSNVASKPETAFKSFGSREFNQDVSRAKRLAIYEPVFVTDRGKPTHVLLNIEAYRHLVGRSDTVADLLAASDPIAVDPDWRAAGPWARRA